MKYQIKNKHEDIVSPHTNKNYLNTVSSWDDEEKINVYHVLLGGNNVIVEGEVIFVEFYKNDVDTSAPIIPKNRL